MTSAEPSKSKSTKDIVLSRSPEETQSLGFRLAQDLPVPSVILLCGSLGTGKTTLTRGIALGLGLKDPSLVNSPSFALVNIYQGKCPIYHVDLYRLDHERDFYSIGLDEILDQEGVTIVEWGERLSIYDATCTIVELEDAGGDNRIIRILNASESKQGVLKERALATASKARGQSRRRRKS